MKPSLLILAAGMGLRYGGSKQIDAVGPYGACLFDYTIYDAIKAGFMKFIFLITKKMEKEFKEAVYLKYGRLLKKGQINIKFAFQELDRIPSGYKLPSTRVKPWGTGHAIFSARDVVIEPFAVINADDYYGPSSYKLMFDALSKMENNSREFFMAGFRVENTLSLHGGVSRGVCHVSDGFLSSIIERENIEKNHEKVIFINSKGVSCEIEPDSIVSMNFWGFAPDTLFPLLETLFEKFIQKNINELKAEFYIPYVIDHAIENKIINVKVLESQESWFGAYNSCPIYDKLFMRR